MDDWMDSATNQFCELIKKLCLNTSFHTLFKERDAHDISIIIYSKKPNVIDSNGKT